MDKTTTLYQGLLKNSVHCLGTVMSTWMAFGGNTLDGDGVASIKRRRRDQSSDGIMIMATASGRGRLKEDLESSTWRRRQERKATPSHSKRIGGVYGDRKGHLERCRVTYALKKGHLHVERPILQIMEDGIRKFCGIEDWRVYLRRDIDVVIGKPFRKVTKLDIDCAKETDNLYKVNPLITQHFNIWMDFGGNTRDLGSIGEETDKTTTLHQGLLKNSIQFMETASQFLATLSYLTSDGVRTFTTASPSKETLEDSAKRRR
ncbi:hypothetical protein Tco_0353613 [Tanacetum coccineum]